MVKIRVIGRSPQGSDSLCKTCTRGHVIKGFRATEELVFCRFFYIEREIYFPVRECIFYEDRRLASKEEMEEIAWRLTTIKPTRHVGFASAVQFRQKQEAAEEPAAIDANQPPSAARRD
jgi:hypothetical protein